MARSSIVLPIVGVAALAAVSVLWFRSRGESQASAPIAGDARDGRAIFLERCAVCHGREAEGAQGPALRGVVGRKAGAEARYGYTKAMRAAELTWDEPTLDKFLSAPGLLVPGSTMTLATTSGADRKAIIAYLSSLGSRTETVASARTTNAGGFRSDAPGVRRRITVADLPAPFASESVRNRANVVDRPQSAEPKLPPGFHATVFAKGLSQPRLLRVTPNGDLFVVESDAKRIQVLRAAAGADAAERVETYATGFDDAFGLAFYPLGPSPKWVYVAEANAVKRFAYTEGDVTARGAPETLIAQLSPTSAGHTMRDLAFSNDGKRMFVAVGSSSNVAEDVAKRTPEAIRELEATHGLGAMWDSEEYRAAVLSFDAEGKNKRVFATGIRNCSGMTVHPKTNDVWCATNERDKLGDDLVPDYVTRVRENAFYGWPWYYLGDHEDPRHAGARKDLAGKVAMPDVLLQSHSAPLQITFYDGKMFPTEYQGSAFVALHGSWNRDSRTGYKVVRILVKDGVPTGEYEDFMTGFVVDDASVWARPVGVTVGNDGALFVGDDANGTIWRITYRANP
ncbi:PQQ-dependent sugar dehydrogenase [Pendulispora rubella]|uniref:PQQ-dependent sugar dehydrogenase n=1 Tax=Pendulispora rubella TaxID=2741070 RepID=A0ABZ2KWG7_9BACT